MIRLTVYCLAFNLCAAELPADIVKKGGGEASVVQRFLMNPYHVNLGVVSSVNADGTLIVKNIANPRFILNRSARGKSDLTEGRYLGFVGKDFVESTTDTRLVSVKVIEVRSKGEAVVRVSAEAAKRIKTGEDLLFFRPPGATTAQLKSAPGYAKVDDGEKDTTLLGHGTVNRQAALATSKNNLKQIGIAMHNYHETFNHFPPAAVYGPDGKPWHSWRVLILPYLEQSAIYRRYRFDEPWNGPNNKKLLAELPAVYRDPIYGEQGDNFYTHYAVVTGKTTIFSPDAAILKKKSTNPLPKTVKGGRFRDITDGTSNTILAGTIGPEHKIPWMKPADVVFTDKFALPGKKGSFAAPYRNRRGSFALIGMADGRVVTVSESIDLKTWRNLAQRNDNNPIGEIPGDGSRPRNSRTGKRPAQVVEIVQTQNGIVARLVSGTSK